MSLFPSKCKHFGCDRTAGVFGVCQHHEIAAINKQFRDVVDKGLASFSPPMCFTYKQWKEYVVAHFLSGHSGRSESSPVDYCRDCSQKHRDKMVRDGMCGHPETVFIRESRGSEVIGVPLVDARRPRVWEQAVMGMSGTVVGLPSAEAIDAATRKIAGTKRGPGRPRKED